MKASIPYKEKKCYMNFAMLWYQFVKDYGSSETVTFSYCFLVFFEL